MSKFNVKSLLDEEFQIFGGRIGSGKTEIAINIAIAMTKLSIPNVLFDMDVVKPYIRIRDIKDKIAKYGIEILAPPDVTRRVDLPILPSNIIGKLMDRGKQKIIDIGGDPYGAGAIAQFKNLFHNGSYNFFFVVNTRRPETSNKEEILNEMKYVQSAARLKITGLVLNTHLRWETTEGTVMEGYRILKEVSEETKLPIYFACVDKKHKDIVKNLDLPILPLELFVNPLPPLGG